MQNSLFGPNDRSMWYSRCRCIWGWFCIIYAYTFKDQSSKYNLSAYPRGRRTAYVKVVGVCHGHPAQHRHRERKIQILGGILKVSFWYFLTVICSVANDIWILCFSMQGLNFMEGLVFGITLQKILELLSWNFITITQGIHFVGIMKVNLSFCTGKLRVKRLKTGISVAHTCTTYYRKCPPPPGPWPWIPNVNSRVFMRPVWGGTASWTSRLSN